MIIYLAKDITPKVMQDHLDNLNSKKRKELFGTETVHKIIAYRKDYPLTPMIFHGEGKELIKHWGKGKEFIYNVG